VGWHIEQLLALNYLLVVAVTSDDPIAESRVSTGFGQRVMRYGSGSERHTWGVLGQFPSQSSEHQARFIMGRIALSDNMHCNTPASNESSIGSFRPKSRGHRKAPPHSQIRGQEPSPPSPPAMPSHFKPLQAPSSPSQSGPPSSIDTTKLCPFEAAALAFLGSGGLKIAASGRTTPGQPSGRLGSRMVSKVIVQQLNTPRPGARFPSESYYSTISWGAGALESTPLPLELRWHSIYL